jgi:hypothetical protein
LRHAFHFFDVVCAHDNVFQCVFNRLQEMVEICGKVHMCIILAHFVAWPLDSSLYI